MLIDHFDIFYKEIKIYQPILCINGSVLQMFWVEERIFSPSVLAYFESIFEYILRE